MRSTQGEIFVVVRFVILGQEFDVGFVTSSPRRTGFGLESAAFLPIAAAICAARYPAPEAAFSQSQSLHSFGPFPDGTGLLIVIP
jgi:hypothetical protein